MRTSDEQLTQYVNEIRRRAKATRFWQSGGGASTRAKAGRSKIICSFKHIIRRAAAGEEAITACGPFFKWEEFVSVVLHCTFGEKQAGASYRTRPGAYLIAVSGAQIASIRTPKGFFLPGGGVEPGETHEACILRECLEETGFLVQVGEIVRLCGKLSHA